MDFRELLVTTEIFMRLFHAYGDYAKLANAVVHRCRNWVGLSIASLPGKLARNLLVLKASTQGSFQVRSGSDLLELGHHHIF